MSSYRNRRPAQIQAYRLSTHCPDCGSPLVVRHSRRTDEPFLGCEAYPDCTYTTPYLPAIQALGEQLTESEEALTWCRRYIDDLRAQLSPQAYHLDPERLDTALRSLAALAHPDRWGNHAVATELTKAVLALRQRVKEGRL